MLNKFQDAPLIGLEFLVEILHGPSSAGPSGGSTDPIYHCILCDKTFDAAGVISDVLSAEHRLAYMVRTRVYVYVHVNVVLLELAIRDTVQSCTQTKWTMFVVKWKAE